MFLLKVRCPLNTDGAQPYKLEEEYIYLVLCPRHHLEEVCVCVGGSFDTCDLLACKFKFSGCSAKFW